METTIIKHEGSIGIMENETETTIELQQEEGVVTPTPIMRTYTYHMITISY